VLVIGYGNPGRCDDGLGPALAARLEALHLPGLTIETSFQLQIEHAELASRHDVVVFADAATDLDRDAPFYLRPIVPGAGRTHFAHSIPPETVLRLAQECYGATPTGWVLGIRPVDIETFAERLTPRGEANLALASNALIEALINGRLAP
jgi:hydrogenase maturation protease